MEIFISVSSAEPLKKISEADRKRITEELRDLDSDAPKWKAIFRLFYERKGPIRGAKVSNTVSLAGYYKEMWVNRPLVEDFFTKLASIKCSDGSPAIGTFDGKTFVGEHTDLSRICGVITGRQKLDYLTD